MSECAGEGADPGGGTGDGDTDKGAGEGADPGGGTGADKGADKGAGEGEDAGPEGTGGVCNTGLEARYRFIKLSNELKSSSKVLTGELVLS